MQLALLESLASPEMTAQIYLVVLRLQVAHRLTPDNCYQGVNELAIGNEIGKRLVLNGLHGYRKTTMTAQKHDDRAELLCKRKTAMTAQISQVDLR